MAAIGIDAKTFTRPKVVRDGSGAVQEVKRDAGFFSQLSTSVHVSDPEAFGWRFQESWADACSKYNVTMRRRFASSHFVVEKLFNSDYAAAISFLYSVLEPVQSNIGKVLFNWVILPPAAVGSVDVGGVGSVKRQIPVQQFVRTVGNMMPGLALWSYNREFGVDYDMAYLDHFQGKTNRAWAVAKNMSGSKIQVVPAGDECNAMVCLADTLAFLTDKRLHANRLKLNPDDMAKVWAEKGLNVRGYYFGQNDLHWMTWTDENPIDLVPHYKRPMTYLLADEQYMGPGDADGEDFTMKRFLKASGHQEIPMLNAQKVGGGAKRFHPTMDANSVRDGDYLVYMGPKSKAAAETYADAYRLHVMSMVQLREQLREEGFNC